MPPKLRPVSELAIGTLRSILRQALISPETFMENL